MRRLFGLGVLLFGALGAAMAAAQSGEVDVIPPFELTTLDCRALLQADGQDERNIMIYLHGYVSGVRDETVIDVARFRAVSDEIV
ncbi:MAG: HdeA/HdeB family chaperone, partial [Pseudomonadota bacterium]